MWYVCFAVHVERWYSNEVKSTCYWSNCHLLPHWANVLTSEPSSSPKERLRMSLKAASSLVQGPLTWFPLYHMLIRCFLWNMILSLCVLQCFCGGEAAVYAHASRQAAGYKNRSAVHKQSQVRCRRVISNETTRTFSYIPLSCLSSAMKVASFCSVFHGQ